jgi:transcriptional regulator with XRE-family HTH domain
MIERILSFIKSRNLSPSQFADEIGVQRSGISHLISGRNKPGLEFLLKIIARYPELDPDWLLTGNGSMFRNGQNSLAIGENVAGSIPVSSQQPVASQEFDFEITKEPEIQEVSKVKRKKMSESDGKQVEKITYFFSDKTFREYFPE